MALQLKWDARPPARPPARRTDNFSKSDNNTLRQILAEGKKKKRVLPLYVNINWLFGIFNQTRLLDKSQSMLTVQPWTTQNLDNRYSLSSLDSERIIGQLSKELDSCLC